MSLDIGARGELAGLIERIERLIEEKKALGDDIKWVFAEAKASGFDPATMRKVIKARALDSPERAEQLALFDLYMHALGLMPDGVADEATLAADRAKRKAAADPKKSKARKKAREAGDETVIDLASRRSRDDDDEPPGGRKH